MPVFYSFNYAQDYDRACRVLDMPCAQGQPLINPMEWAELEERGEGAVKEWIDGQLSNAEVVVVLVGEQTSQRRWVMYEIAKAWEDRIPVVGVRVHRLEDAAHHTSAPGADPFLSARPPSACGSPLNRWVPLWDPAGVDSDGVAATIEKNLSTWIHYAVKRMDW